MKDERTLRDGRTRVRRLPDRGRYDAETIHAILDAGLIAHVGYVIDGQPYVTPTSYWRLGNLVYWHGSSASRMLRSQAEQVPVCFTVTHVDGIVLARSAFHHSMNYRSVMALGHARVVRDDEEKLAALKRFVERVAPGRWDDVRPPTANELTATTVLAMTLDEVSAKVRTGPPKDDAPDYERQCWAGVVPLAVVADAPAPDPELRAGIELPAYIAAAFAR